MTTQVNIAGWSKTLSLDRHVTQPVFHGFVDLPSDSNDVAAFSPSSLNSRELNQCLNSGDGPVYKSSFLYSVRLKRNLEESRKAFLNFSIDNNEEHQQECLENAKENGEQKKTPSRKISFKCKKPTSYRRTPVANSKITTTLNPTTVAELTTKFNGMVAEKNSILDQPKFARLVRRVNSQRSTPAQEDGANKRVARKPSVKLKPKPEERKRPSVKQRTIIHKNSKTDALYNSDMCVRAKISYLEIPQVVKMSDVSEIDGLKNRSKTSQNSGSVRAAIEIFERRSSQSSPDCEQKSIVKETEQVPKPKVPEKNPNIKIKDLVIKDGIRKLKVFEKRDSNDNVSANQNSSKPTTDINLPLVSNIDTNVHNLTVNLDETSIATKNVLHKTDFINPEASTENAAQIINESTNNTIMCIQEPNEQSKSIETKTEIEDEVQILNIPLVMPRRCDSMYETLSIRKISPPPHLLKMSRSEGAVPIINTIPTVLEPVKPNTSFLWRRKSHETQTNMAHNENKNIDSSKSMYDKVETVIDASKNPAPPAVPPRPTSLNFSSNKPLTPPKIIFKKKMPLPKEPEEKIYEELGDVQAESDTISHNYEYCRSPSKYEDLEQKNDDGYECFESHSPTKQEKFEDLYEILPAHSKSPPPLLPRRQEEPLPPRPPSGESYCTIENEEDVSNCYESIYNAGERNPNTTDAETISNNYESIYGCQIRSENWELGSNRDSLVSSDQQSNSLYSRSLSGWPNDFGINLYNGKAPSDLSGSDKSDEWIDISDNEDNSKGLSGFVIVRERQRNRKTAGWSQKIRDQWNKSHSEGDSNSDHHYESLYKKQIYQDNDDFDSFESDTESENSFTKINQNDSGVDMGNSQLPDPPVNQSYGFTRLAVSAGKHMKRLRRNWSLTKNDITKSLSRMAKRKSRTDLDSLDSIKTKEEKTSPASSSVKAQIPRPISSPVILHHQNALSNITQELKMRQADSQVNSVQYQDTQITTNKDITEPSETFEKVRSNSLSKNKFLNKFRRSMSSIGTETPIEVSPTLGNKPKSTFYLTDTIDVDDKSAPVLKMDDNNSSVSPPLLRNSKIITQRPQSPPPPVPIDPNIDSSKLTKLNKRSTSWYAECGLFRNSENMALQNLSKRPNTSWYAEIGLYQSSTSTPSTSSAENSGSTTNVNTKSLEPDSLTDIKDNDDYYNLKNESDYYNQSIDSFNSDTTVEKCSNISADIQLRLQDEPLYQFYDAAVLESVCQDGTIDFDYDGYEEVGDKSNSDYSDYSENRLTPRPTAMQLITPSKNGVTVIRTLWCEIPEVLQSAVLSTLSIQQKKLQEAKFEMMTSEASYLNSLNVLTDHFISNFTNSDLLSYEEKNILFGKIPAVKRCSEKLLLDLEKCWQDNVLLYGICDIIQKHAEENFYVYVSYCENQILLDSTLRKIRERSTCNELLKQLECCSACQSLSLYSFLMLPMQRVTRWPLLVDAVLKRLAPQDDEYLPCQYTLATINKIVTQCNEAARNMERETEIKRIATQIEYPRGIPSIKLASGSRWLIRSGLLTQMQARADDTKLTFGKRFIKVPLHLFLFNDLLLVTKPRSDDCFVVQHYCFRSYIELNVNDVIGSLPTKDTQGRHLLFLTILENHEGKTVEMLLSCNSESDKERWIEALSAPKSEDPNETLYECWDCPQVTAIHNYCASQPDELALARGDTVNVTRKMADGWFHGERIRDGRIGWFPANYTVEVANPHVRARNLKQRYRLLAFSENYLKTK